MSGGQAMQGSPSWQEMFATPILKGIIAVICVALLAGAAIGVAYRVARMIGGW